MSVGAPQDKNATDAALYGLSSTLRHWCSQVDQCFLWFTGMTPEERGAIYPTPADLTLATDAVYSYKSLADVMRGLASPALPNNFLQSGTKILGPNG